MTTWTSYYYCSAKMLEIQLLFSVFFLKSCWKLGEACFPGQVGLDSIMISKKLMSSTLKACVSPQRPAAVGFRNTWLTWVEGKSVSSPPFFLAVCLCWVLLSVSALFSQGGCEAEGICLHWLNTHIQTHTHKGHFKQVIYYCASPCDLNKQIQASTKVSVSQGQTTHIP